MAALTHYAHEFLSNLATNPRAAAGTIAGASTGYFGYTVMDYNKDNFTTDNGNRFTRFQAARSNMMAQVGLYRQDIRGIVGVTVTKAHVFLDTAQLFMCTSAALSCAGRVGMHGSAPPGYLCALYSGHIFLGVMYLTICLWLGFHAALRAQCGMVSLLTRKVRLPVPPLWLIDQSRCFASGYEKQKFWDILRFPFMPHPHDAPDIPGASSSEDEGGEGKDKKKSGKEKIGERHGDYAASEDFGSTGRNTVPSWIRDENVIDKGNKAIPYHDNDGGVRLPGRHDAHDVPDHFKLLTEAQKEWFPYETYHRISLLFGVCCFFHAVTYYCIATAMSELRGFWIAWSIPGLFMVAQYWLVQLDIFNGQGVQFLRGCEWFGHIAPYFATAACMCEFRFQYSKAQVALAWTFALACLGCHLVFACRFWDLMSPDTLSKEMLDADGKSFWPKSFSAPLAFIETLWQITPPKKLKKGQHDLLHEAWTLEKTKAGVGSCKLRKRKNKGGKSSGSRREHCHDEGDLQQQLSHLEGRMRNVFDQMPSGKGQDQLSQLYGRACQAKKDVEALGGRASKEEKLSMTPDQKQLRIRDAAEELNAIEDDLVHFERAHEVEDDDMQIYGMGTATDGSTKGLPATPYWIMRFAVATHIFVWFFIICATVAEVVLGSQAILSPPGEPAWIRNQKMRIYQPDKDYLHTSDQAVPSWYRLFTSATIPDVSQSAHGHGGHSSGGHSGGHSPAGGHSPTPAPHSTSPHAHSPTPAPHSPAPHAPHGGHGGRRMQDQASSDAFSELIAMLPSLDWLADELQKDTGALLPTSPRTTSAIAGLPTSMAAEAYTTKELHESTVPTGGFMSPSLRSLPVEWPPLFEPHHLACQTRSSGTAVVALTPRGVGALVHLKNASITAEGNHAVKSLTAESFSLAGVTPHGTLVGASWITSGLRLITNTGLVLNCHGHGPESGAWPCEKDGGMSLPLSSSSRVKAAALAEHVAGERLVALLFEDMPTTVVLYKSSATSEAWMPAGEMRLPPGSGHAGLGFANDMLMVIAEDGAVHYRPLRDDVKPLFSPPPSSATYVSREWHSACAATRDQGVMRLALRQAGPATWRPELVLAAQKRKLGLVNV